MFMLMDLLSFQVLWPTNIELVKEDELLILTFEETLPLGDALLSMDFQGTLNDQMKGFYRRYPVFATNTLLLVSSLCLEAIG